MYGLLASLDAKFDTVRVYSLTASLLFFCGKSSSFFRHHPFKPSSLSFDTASHTCFPGNRVRSLKAQPNHNHRRKET